MKKYFFVIALIICCMPQISLGHSNQLPDSLIIKAKKLKHLYLLSTASSYTQSEIYKQQFFNDFPSTFKQLNELYGYNSNTHKPAPLYENVETHILDLFNNLNCINDTTYYKKIVSIAIGGHWDADAVNFFQDGLHKRALNNPDLIVYVLKSMNDSRIRSFWYFYFDGVHPKKQIPMPLQKIKSIDKKIYDLMLDSQNEVLKQPKE